MLTCNFIWLYSGSEGQVLEKEACVSIPERYQDLELEKCSLSDLEQKFSKQFPGIIETYQHRTGVIIFRQVTGATRKLHDSRTCLKASGFELSEPEQEKDKEGVIWQTYKAKNDEATLVVRSVIISPSDNRNWSTVGGWFWDAFFSSSDKTYLAITEISD